MARTARALLTGLRRMAMVVAAAIALSFLLLAGWFLLPAGAPGDGPRVIVIGIDGLTARALFKGNSPTLDMLADRGAFTLKAQAVLPTMSSPNWATMLMGAGPERHGITANAWRPADWPDESLCGREPGAGWPTLFDLLRAKRPDRTGTVIYDWVGIGRFVPREAADFRLMTHTRRLTALVAWRQLRRQGPGLSFVHFDSVDGAGHAFGFDSWRYLREVERVDASLRRIYDVLERRDGFAQTVLLITSDHGGLNRVHGGDTAEERDIPWILFGAGVREGHEIAAPVSIADTSPTLAWRLGLEIPDCWTGQPVREAFESAP